MLQIKAAYFKWDMCCTLRATLWWHGESIW